MDKYIEHLRARSQAFDRQIMKYRLPSEKRFEKRKNRKRGKSYIEFLNSHTPLQGKKVLDFGCGWGEYMYEAHERGADVYGLEPYKEDREVARLLMAQKGAEEKVQGYEEDIRSTSSKQDMGFQESHIPFEDETFDVVYSCSVLEHVGDYKGAIAEMVRVLKRGGVLAIDCPNYAYPKEHHYKMWWIPGTPKWLGKYILKMTHRDPAFLEHIRYVTHRGIKKEMEQYAAELRDVSQESMQAELQMHTGSLKKAIMKTIYSVTGYPTTHIIIHKK